MDLKNVIAKSPAIGHDFARESTGGEYSWLTNFHEYLLELCKPQFKVCK